MSLPQDNREVAQSSNQGCGEVPAAALKSAEKETRRLATSHYENFLVASVMLPRRLRQPFYNVYAFCRMADDLADQSPSPDVALERLDAFQTQLNETFAGTPGDHLFVALCRTIERHDLPKQPFDDLLDAFRQDQRKTRYENMEELLEYCRRSANPVGQIVLSLGGIVDMESAALSDEICTGLQLANFWQDVARDFASGRVYLPSDEMERFGVNESMLAESNTSVDLRRLLASECDRAEAFLRRGLPLSERVPRWMSADIKLFAHGGLATLDAIRRIDFDVLRRRPTVSKWCQSGLMFRAILGWL